MSEQQSILADLKQVRSEIHSKASGSAPAEPEVVEPAAPSAEPIEAAAPAEAETPAPAAEPAEEELITIGDQKFKTKEEAFKYAESLQQKELMQSVYQQGVQEAIRALKPEAAAEPAPEEDDTEYYVDPKAAIAKAEERATKRAVEQIKKEQQAEQLWNQFETKYPDIRRSDAERILREPENWNSIGKLADHDKAMSLLATKVRAEYQEIIDRVKPRSALPNKSGQAVSSGHSSAPSGVTPKKEPAATNFIAEMKKMRR